MAFSPVPESGEPGKGYILSSCYVTIRRMLQLVGKAAKLKYRPICLPLGLAGWPLRITSAGA